MLKVHEGVCVTKIVKYKLQSTCGGGLTISVSTSDQVGLGSSPGQEHCIVFLGNALHSHSASLYLGVQMGTGKFDVRGNPMMDEHPIQLGVEILLAASCYFETRDKRWPDVPLGLYANLTLHVYIISIYIAMLTFVPSSMEINDGNIGFLILYFSYHKRSSLVS